MKWLCIINYRDFFYRFFVGYSYLRPDNSGIKKASELSIMGEIISSREGHRRTGLGKIWGIPVIYGIFFMWLAWLLSTFSILTAVTLYSGVFCFESLYGPVILLTRVSGSLNVANATPLSRE